MTGTAVLSAEKMVLSRSCRLKPHGSVLAGNAVLFDAKCGDVKTVNHVLRCVSNLHGPADRDMELIDFAAPVRMLDLPHPLLADDIDVFGARRWNRFVQVQVGAPDEHDHNQDSGNDAPEDFESHRVMGLLGFTVRPPAVAHGKDNDEDNDKQSEQSAHAGQKPIEHVVTCSERRSLLWNETKTFLHFLGQPLLSRSDNHEEI